MKKPKSKPSKKVDKKIDKEGADVDAQLQQVVDQVDDFLMLTEDARTLSERDRDYYDHKQWTAQEAQKLTARGQAPVVVNRIRPKINGLVGLVSVRKSDPKAYPRTKKHEKASEAVTDALRFVADKNDIDEIKREVSENFFVEGYGGASVIVRQNGAGEVEVVVEGIPWDRIYFDPKSRRRDFKDSRYLGFMQWMDEDELLEKFPDADPDTFFVSTVTDSTFEDRPRWVQSTGKRKRVRIAVHYYIKDGVWWMCIFTQAGFLMEPQESPYLDEFGQPDCPIELASAYIDRDNNRSGEARSFIDMQDEINHRRSKGLHLLSTRQTFGNKKAGIEVATAKRELAKANGHLELLDGEFNKDFGILTNGDMSAAQFQLYQDAKSEMDATSYNAQLAGERQSGDLSGKAIDRLQQAGTIELNGLFTTLNGWEKRIYRQAWSRIKQFWTEEKWIRVTDDQDALRWVGLNSQVTMQELLEETINDDSKPLAMRKGAAAVFTELMQSQDPAAQQQLEQIVEVRNEVAELDVDIILDQSFDTVNIQQEQFELLAKFANGSDIDILELIELSQLRGKDELIEKIQKRRQEAAQSAGNMASKQAESIDAKNRETMSKAALNEQNAVQKQVETQLLIANPQPVNATV